MKNNSPSQMMAWLLAGAAGFFIGVLALLTLIAITDFDYWTAGEHGSSRSEVLRNFIFMGVGVIGAIFASVRLYYLDQQTKIANRQADTANQEAKTANEQAKIANKQQASAERGQITERFSRAVEYLGNEYTAVRLGGVYALWRLLDEIPSQNEETQQKDVV